MDKKLGGFMFTDCQYMSRREKELVLKAWKSFIKALKACDFDKLRGSDYGSFPTDLDHSFNKRLYKHLANNFGNIAHYNKYGFLHERFGSLAKANATLNEMVSRRWPCHRDYEDINEALLQELRCLAT